MREINIGAAVLSNGREVGSVEQVVLDCDSYEAAHFVIKHGGALQSQLRLMPADWVTSAEHDSIHISRTENELSELPVFELQHYTRLDQLDEEHDEHPRSKIRPSDWVYYFVPMLTGGLGEPYAAPGVRVTEPQLAASESALRRGLPVESSDGQKVGEVQEVLFSEPDWRLSGVIIGRGFIRTHPMRVPADWITRISAEKIVLNRSKSQVEQWEKESA
ncbi:MAG TPA: PRC-barrel domain-containing protein [Blastocatellia bacterium]|nr:PRC-barrel domain-containing protein [Blastocatellia bacterium]HMV82037.1 PRC-barrel domain-containing protein [Blastocatellia bacterium]HMX24039.1 PRC-barrel domain-containing protein [Blastocatellia bacterium]HMY72774.1 PRC-barrel domain-containing protein [Blastocatellia bacterium]HMZ16934.1 PRC-barrel domain-containing protein [Blastocatellia bacterium]